MEKPADRGSNPRDPIPFSEVTAMSLEKINSLFPSNLTETERLSKASDLVKRHGVLLDRIKNNTDRPKGKKPGGWPCQCYSDVELLLGPENLSQIFNSIAEYESCHDRRAKLTMHTANNQFHTIKPPIRAAFVSQFEQFGRELAAYRAGLERKQQK